MLSNHFREISTPLLPDDLHTLLCQRAPGQVLGLVLVDQLRVLNGTHAQMVDAWLTADEKLQLERYTFEKRRNEWFLGRICAKQSTIELLARLGIDSLKPLEITIAVGTSGRPFLKLPEIQGLEQVPDISISHSHGKVIGLAGICHVGIDIQLLTDTLFKVRDRFCSGPEMALLNDTYEDERAQLGMLWVAKEAIRKSLERTRPAGFHTMRLNEIHRMQDYWLLDFHLDDHHAGAGVFSTVVHISDRYCLGVCTLPGAQGDA
jgi:phosphopantetheinyl transferase